MNHCRIWDGQTMHYLADVFTLQDDYAAVWLEDALVLINRVNPRHKRRYEPTSPWQLMLSVGQADRHGTPLYDQDIVESDGYRWVVRHHPERCGYSLFMPQTMGLPPSVSLDQQLAHSLTVIGNCLEDPRLLLDSVAHPHLA